MCDALLFGTYLLLAASSLNAGPPSASALNTVGACAAMPVSRLTASDARSTAGTSGVGKKVANAKSADGSPLR